MKKKLLSLSFAFVALISLQTNAQTIDINTIAGNGTAGYGGDGGVSTSAILNLPIEIALDGSGNLYIADRNNHRIRKINTSGIISTIAGNGNSGYTGDGGAATSAELNSPEGIAADASGNIYFADVNNKVIRKINTSGIISTYAGNGATGYTGDGGPATSAEFNSLYGIALDPAGNLYIADLTSNVIREVNTSGIISTYAGNGTAGFSGDGSTASTAELKEPVGVAVDAAGNVYIADYGNNRIREVNTSGIINTIAGNGTAAYSGDGGTATSAELNSPFGVAVDTTGNLYIADEINNRVREVNTSGIINTIAGNGTQGYSGDGGAATSAELYRPTSVAVDAAKNVYIADFNNNRVRELSPCTSSPGDTTATACSNFTWYGTTYTSSGTPTYTLMSADGCDSIVTLHLTINQPTTGDTTATACSSFMWYGTTYTSSGTPTHVLTSVGGCDSTVTLTLTITQPTSSTLTQTACSSYTLNSQTYNTSGTYTQTLTNSAGCDSTLTLNLTITQPTSSTLTQTACSSYTLNTQTYNTSGTYTQTITNSAGCDSTLTLNLTINQPTTGDTTATACTSFMWYGTTFTSSGTPTHILTNSTGCDSTLTLNLTINTVDTTVTQTSDTLMANASGATYQWISCGSPDLLIAGATNQSFTPAANGYYAVVVTQGICSDTSACHDVTTTGINNYSLNSNNINIYPMPNDGHFAITFTGIGYQAITVYNELGKEISTQVLDDKNPNISLTLNLSQYPSGIYFAKILTSHGLENKKILIQK